MNHPFIYLAGPIFGCTEGEAKDWRKHVAAELEEHCITGVSRLRCEPLVGARYDLAYDDPCFGQPKSILAKNFLDLRRCALTLAYFPAPTEHAELQEIALRLEQNGERGDGDTLRRIARKSPQRSIGTIGELSWAYALNKPCVVVTDDPLIKHHPFTAVQPSWPVLDNLDDALRLIVGIFGAYAGGKNV